MLADVYEYDTFLYSRISFDTFINNGGEIMKKRSTYEAVMKHIIVPIDRCINELACCLQETGGSCLSKGGSGIHRISLERVIHATTLDN